MRCWRSLLLAALLVAGGGLAAGANEPVMLDDAAGAIELWPAVTVLREEGAPLDIGAAIGRRSEFAPPKYAYAALGFDKVVWLRVPMVVSASSDGDWILDFEYTLLNHIDVYLVDKNGVRERHRLGNGQPFSARPLSSRTHAVQFQFAKGEQVELYLRVESVGSKILPIRLSKISAFHLRGLNEQILQGVLISIALCLLLYSLMKWVSLREHLYGKYALLVFTTTLFSVHFFGIGSMYLWTDIQWLERHLAGITSLTAAAATALFIEDALGSDLHPWLRRGLYTVVAVVLCAAVAYGLDFIDIQTVGVLMGTFGLAPALMGLPGAVKRERKGDSTGAYFIIAWVGYFVASAVMVGVVKGHIGANFWTLHSFQFGSTLDVLIFMRIAVLRSELLHRAAQRATRERDSLISLAHSDPLTGLLNRRGLSEALARELGNASVARPVAIYVLDLDRFKPVNDLHGHDVGDQLLIAVASRLRNSVRAGDAVARLGGDEFVIMASGLSGEGQATDLGQKLLDCFVEPFAVSDSTFSIGATVGFALAPADGIEAARLLKIADNGLYTGKQEGRHCLRRGQGGGIRAPGVD